MRSRRSDSASSVVAGITTAPSFIAASIVSHSSTWLPSISTIRSPRATPCARSQFATWSERVDQLVEGQRAATSRRPRRPAARPRRCRARTVEPVQRPVELVQLRPRERGAGRLPVLAVLQQEVPQLADHGADDTTRSRSARIGGDVIAGSGSGPAARPRRRRNGRLGRGRRRARASRTSSKIRRCASSPRIRTLCTRSNPDGTGHARWAGARTSVSSSTGRTARSSRPSGSGSATRRTRERRARSSGNAARGIGDVMEAAHDVADVDRRAFQRHLFTAAES